MQCPKCGSWRIINYGKGDFFCTDCGFEFFFLSEDDSLENDEEEVFEGEEI